MLLEAQAMKLKAELYSRGFLIVPGLVSPEICASAATAIRGRTTRVLKMMGHSAKGHFKSLMDADWIHSPDGWNGPVFGPICARGWQQGPGTGRIGLPLPEISIHSRMDSGTRHHRHCITIIDTTPRHRTNT